MNLKCLFKGHDKKLIYKEHCGFGCCTSINWKCRRCGKVKLVDMPLIKLTEQEAKELIGDTDVV